MVELNPIVNMVLTVVCAVIASNGFWTWWMHRQDKNSATNRLLIGLAHDRIMTLGMQYIHQGSITADEYENFRTYLYEPYHDAGGNGSATKIMAEVDRLPIRSSSEDFKS
ncbi:MAG: hypothetical protein IJ087_17890 [Eggerthellaceae bacterium]|nr:hypothetical protein [Eggerthellaceae bacterium]